MDGVYITSRLVTEMRNLLTYIYRAHTIYLCDTENFKHWFMIRGAISYGSVIHGKDVPYNASTEFATRIGYKEQLLIGMPMIEAYIHERDAAPMGLYSHDSCNEYIPAQWKWYANLDVKMDFDTIYKFKNRAVAYYNWIDENISDEEYARDRRKFHMGLLKQYFEIP